MSLPNLPRTLTYASGPFRDVEHLATVDVGGHPSRVIRARHILRAEGSVSGSWSGEDRHDHLLETADGLTVILSGPDATEAAEALAPYVAAYLEGRA